MAQRILVLGVTGVDKGLSLRRLREWREREADASNLLVLDFEKEFVEPRAGGLYHYLDALELLQRELWEEGWHGFGRLLDQNREKDVILSMHATLVRPTYGIRSPLLIDSIREFAPTMIVNLIDDVYSMWYRTERRAEHLDWKGRPSLEQLVSARRAELFLGDIIARQLPSTEPVRNYMVAVQHPARVLHRLIFGPRSLKRIYWSFPISEPRRQEENGDLSGIQEVNDFLTSMSAFERETPDVVGFCPLTIDELPLVRLGNSLPPDSEIGDDDEIDFELRNRWNVRSFWEEEPLLIDDSSLPDTLSLRSPQVRQVQGMIRADVATRDLHLVRQSSRLAVFNPVFRDRLSRGVDSEIASALAQSIPVEIYQDPRHDPNNLARQTYRRPAGSLGLRPGQEYITFHDSIERLVNVLRTT